MNIEIVTPQFDRAETLDFETIPQTAEEFQNIVNHAPIDILFGFGFRKWDSMNSLIAENQKMEVLHPVSLPTINLTDSPDNDVLTLMIGRKDNYPMELLEQDEDVVLIPAEWYDVIPEGFEMTSLHGETEAFRKGVTDDDRRFGCLAYGIRRPIV